MKLIMNDSLILDTSGAELMSNVTLRDELNVTYMGLGDAALMSSDVVRDSLNLTSGAWMDGISGNVTVTLDLPLDVPVVVHEDNFLFWALMLFFALLLCIGPAGRLPRDRRLHFELRGDDLEADRG